ncbi:transglutaminase-like domain-containing protein [Limibacillus sp. MBR-115]|uniref:SirB1 family protein n=1 Tax=Limibacillus sp. MBR-115 TaxID=3156465 RepID=UPI0033973CE6
MSDRWQSALAVPARSELEARLRQLTSGQMPIDRIAEAALLMAGLDRPGKAMVHYLDHLEELARDTAAAAADLGANRTDIWTPDLRLEALRGVFAVRHGYCGDHESYDDPQNANLMSVIERRRGLPVSLGILTLQVARAQGWHMNGVSFPGHFLISMDTGGARVIIDPFNGWRQLAASDIRELLKAITGLGAELSPAHYAAVDDRHVLLRLQNNVKLRAVQAGRLSDGLASLEIMLMIAPDSAELWREAALLHINTDNLRAAIPALERFIKLAPSDPRADEAFALIRDLRHRLN